MQEEKNAPAEKEPGLYIVKRDGVPQATYTTHNDAWLHIHRASYGASVDWLMRYEGWAIEGPK